MELQVLKHLPPFAKSRYAVPEGIHETPETVDIDVCHTMSDIDVDILKPTT